MHLNKSMVRFLSNFTVILSALFLLSPDVLHADCARRWGGLWPCGAAGGHALDVRWVHAVERVEEAMAVVRGLG